MRIADRPRLLFTIAALVLLALAYAGRLDGDYVWDDTYLVRDNASLIGAAGLHRIFTTDLWSSAGQPRSQLFHPLPMLSFWIQAQLGVLTVVASRLVNLALHLACGYAFLCLLLRSAVPPLAAAMLALVFVAHPSATEPVMWLTGRHDLLATLFALGAFLAWPDGKAERRWRRATLAALFCAGAFLCKEPYIVIPGLLLFVAGGQRVEDPRALLRSVLPIGAIGAVLAWRRVLGIMSGSDQLAAPLGEHARNGATILAHYVCHIITVSDGPTIETFHASGSGMAFLVGTGVLGLAIPIVIFRARVAARWGGFALAWLLLALAPHVLSLPLIGLWSNRYAYFPTAAVLAFVGAACTLASDRALRSTLVRACVALTVVLLATGALRTRGEALAWHDDLALYGASVEAHPEDGRALYHLGHAIYARRGCAAALPYYDAAAQHAPAYARASRNLAGCLINLGRPGDAIAPARLAVLLEPEDSSQQYNLGAALALSGHSDEAMAVLARALVLDPKHARAAALLARLRTASAEPTLTVPARPAP